MCSLQGFLTNSKLKNIFFEDLHFWTHTHTKKISMMHRVGIKLFFFTLFIAIFFEIGSTFQKFPKFEGLYREKK